MISTPYDAVHKARWVADIQPKTVLDIGVGFGSFGVMVRERTDLTHQRWKRDDWQVWIEGLEIYRPYIEEFKHLKYIYDDLLSIDIYDFIKMKTMPMYDLIHAGDVIEHMEKDKGIAVLEWIPHHCKNFILSIPIDELEFDYESDYNPYDNHISVWSEDELKGFYKGIGMRGNAGQVNTYWFKYTKEIHKDAGN